MIRLQCILAALALAGGLLSCKGGSSGDFPHPVPPPPPPVVSLWSVNLSTGEPTASPPSPVGAAHGGSQCYFRRVAPTATVVSGADAITENGTASSSAVTPLVSPAPFTIGMVEVTQGQWSALVAGSGLSGPLTPWTGVSMLPSGTLFSTATDLDKPAYNLSGDQIQTVLTAWNGRNTAARLRLPTSQEWEIACRNGATSGARFGWGETTNDTVVGTFARVRLKSIDDATANAGPDAVAGRLANDFGLHDLHGNVWEWVSDGGGTGASPCLRGGSWFDQVERAATGNRLDLPANVPYALAGFRLVLEIK